MHDIASADLMEKWTDSSSEFELFWNEKCYYHVRISSVVDQKARLLGKTVVFNDVTERVLLAEKRQRLAIAQRPVCFDNQFVSVTASFGVAAVCGHGAL